MFLLKSNGSTATAIAGSDDIKLLKRVGAKKIAKLDNGLAILTRLVNSNYLPEGKY